MKNYPNEEALRKAHRIYLDAMRPFIIRCLRRIQGRTLEDLIRDVSDYEPNDDIETLIDVNNIPLLVRNHWYDIFSQEFNSDLNVQNTTWLIVEGRNLWAHPGKEDIDPESTRMHLSLAVRVLDEIKNPRAKEAVETVRDQLFSDEVEVHPLESENAANKEQIANLTTQLAEAEAKRTELLEQLEVTSNRLEEVEAEWIASDERLTNMLHQLEIVKAEKETSKENLTALISKFEALELEKTAIENQLKETESEWASCEKHLKATSNQLEVTNEEKTEYEKSFKTVSGELDEIKILKADLEKRLEEVNQDLEEAKEELNVCREQLALAEAEKAKYEEALIEEEPLLIPTLDSLTFQESTFTKHLNEYYVAGSDISQTFWRYWHAQGREGKQKMRDAGWSVEKVENKWEITVSPEDFQAWIENEGLTVQAAPPFHERVEQPVINFLADQREHRRVEIINLIAELFSLNEVMRSHLSNSGRIEKHLISKGLIERTRTGYYRITAHGLELADSIPFL